MLTTLHAAILWVSFIAIIASGIGLVYYFATRDDHGRMRWGMIGVSGIALLFAGTIYVLNGGTLMVGDLLTITAA